LPATKATPNIQMEILAKADLEELDRALDADIPKQPLLARSSDLESD
jgi:hypothetical protein